jgi:hypothetical protein
VTHEDLGREEVVKAGSERRFGQVFAVVFAVIGCLMLWYRSSHWPYAFGLAIVFAALALWAPRALYWPNRLWFGLGLLLHKIIQPIILGILLYLVVTPIGLIMRLAGKDPLRLKFNKDAKSYWLERGPSSGSMSKQF